MNRLAERRVAVLGVAVAVGVVCGAATVRKPTIALALGFGIAGLLALLVAGRRSFAWAIVIVAVAPWYPFTAVNTSPPVLAPRIFCTIIAAAPLVPWLWSIAATRAVRPPSRLALVYSLAFPLLAVSIHSTLNSVKDMIQAPVFGLLFGGAAFLCARHFGRTTAWPVAAFAGLCALVAMGFLNQVAQHPERVGGFTGYPITYGALVVGLLPSAITYAMRRSTLLAVVTGAAASVVLILSQSRSSWIATVVLLLVVVAVLLRQRRWRELCLIGGLTVLAAGAILSTGSLHGIVERKLSSNEAQSDSVTHRVYSYGYAAEQIRKRPLFGAGAPGYSAQQIADETDIGALDNGFLSITVDIGAFGLLVVLVPILLAVALLTRWLAQREPPPPDDLALVLGVLGIAVVTVFYDSFYWAQLSLLLGAMGGTLSARWTSPQRARARQRAAKSRRLALLGDSL